MAAASRSARVAFLALLFSLSSALPPPSQGSSLLVVTDSSTTERTHAQLLASLRDRGYTLAVAVAETASNAELALNAPGKAYSDYQYGGILLLCPTAKGMEKKLPLDDLLRFVDKGGNLFVAGGGGYTPWLASVSKAFGVSLDRPGNRVIDHQRAFPALDEGDRTWLTAGRRANSPYLFGDATGDVVFNGPGAGLFADNELVEAVIWGSGSSYSGEPGKAVTSLPHESGSATVLAATLSTRIGSRFAFFGSYDALSDDVFDAADAGHAGTLTSLVAWAFGHRGVLRAQNLRYWTEREGADESAYRVKDDIHVAVDIQAWDGNRGVWGEFQADDVQLEFVMLNPWVRTRLASTGNGDNSTYTAVVPVPDQIGIYKLRIAYYRTGVTGLELEHVVPIRPFLHNEYPRFIPMAYPYYAACFAMMASVFMLGLALNFGNAAVSTTARGVETNLPDSSSAGSTSTTEGAVKGGTARTGGGRARRRH
jgi:oligosaccharyltransferase complex subunit beta